MDSAAALPGGTADEPGERLGAQNGMSRSNGIDEALEEGVGDDELVARQGGVTGPPKGPRSRRRRKHRSDVEPDTGVSGAVEELPR
eukprot:8818707-Alexandrium_andersonii.AAC.1